MSKRPMRLAYLVSRYPALSHTFVLREVIELRKLGIHIETASVNRPDMAQQTMPAQERLETARTYYIKQHGVIGALQAHCSALLMEPAGYWRGLYSAFRLGGHGPLALSRSLAYLTQALMLGRWMRRHELHHLHVHFATAAACVGYYAKRVFGVTLSLTVHGPDEFDNVKGHWLETKFLSADFLFCIGQFARSQVMRLMPPQQWNKIDIAPLGVDVQAYYPAQAPIGAGRPLRVLCVGRLVAAKGQHILISAAAQLQRWQRPIHITFVGDGPDGPSLRQAVEAAGLGSVVEFCGALNQTKVRAQYQQADLFVLPSFAEGIPVVLMEAMASGLPCVSTRINGIAELIQNEREGMLLAPSDAHALARALRDLMDDPLRRHRMGRAGRQRVERDFDLQRNTARLAGLFAQRLEEPSC